MRGENALNYYAQGEEKSMKLHYLNDKESQEVFDAVMVNYNVEKTAWVDAPRVLSGELVHTSGYGEKAETCKVSVEEALAIYNKKVDGAYTERLLLFVAQLEAIVKNGYKVALIQNQGHDGAPFNSEGWLVVVVETMPIYHIAPWDLNLNDVKELVTLIPSTESDNELISWKRTDKRGEIMSINAAITGGGKNLVEIAQRFSNLD